VWGGHGRGRRHARATLATVSQVRGVSSLPNVFSMSDMKTGPLGFGGAETKRMISIGGQHFAECVDRAPAGRSPAWFREVYRRGAGSGLLVSEPSSFEGGYFLRIAKERDLHRELSTSCLGQNPFC
jgi:hypothetical protein